MISMPYFSAKERIASGKLIFSYSIKNPLQNKDFLNDIKEFKIFPGFVSDNFYKLQNNNIHLIGDAFFAFPPSLIGNPIVMPANIVLPAPRAFGLLAVVCQLVVKEFAAS